MSSRFQKAGESAELEPLKDEDPRLEPRSTAFSGRCPSLDRSTGFQGSEPLTHAGEVKLCVRGCPQDGVLRSSLRRERTDALPITSLHAPERPLEEKAGV